MNGRELNSFMANVLRLGIASNHLGGNKGRTSNAEDDGIPSYECSDGSLYECSDGSLYGVNEQ